MLPKRVDSVSLVVQQTTSVWRGVLLGCEDVGLGQVKTTALHGFVKYRTLPPVGVDDCHIFLFDEVAQSRVERAGVQNRRLRGPLGPLPSM